MIKNLGPFIEASHRYAFIFELLAFWQAIQAWFTSGDSSLLLMERILLTSWGNGSWSVYLICLARFCTSQMVVWDFLTINSMLQKVRSEKEVKNKAPLVPLRKKLGALKITKSFWSVCFPSNHGALFLGWYHSSWNQSNWSTTSWSGKRVCCRLNILSYRDKSVSYGKVGDLFHLKGIDWELPSSQRVYLSILNESKPFL